MKIHTKIILIISLFMLIGSIFFLLDYAPVGRAVEEEIYTHTKAICNETKKGVIYCEDYEVSCKGKEAVGIKATGFFTQHPENWTDPRGKNGSEITC